MNKTTTYQSRFRLVALPILMAALFLMLIAGDSYEKLFVNSCVAIAAALILFQMLAIHMEGEKNWVQIDLLFMIVFFMIHFWIWISLQINDDKALIWYSKSPSQVNYTAALTLAAMAAFACGFNLPGKKTPETLTNNTVDRSWLVIGYFVFYIGALLVLSYATYFGAEAFKGAYGGSSVGGIGIRSVYLLQSILLNLGIAIILIANSDPERRIPKPKVPVVIFMLVLLMYLVLGDRSEFVFSASIFSFAYSRHYKSISLKYLMAGIVVLALLMSAVQVARTAEERSLSGLIDALLSESEEVSASSALDNIGSTGLVTLVAVQSIPDKHDYFYGKLKVLELMGIIPFARQIFITEEDLKLPYKTTSEFLTWKILGPRSNTGAGTSLVADLYIDFGVIGVLCGFALLGYLVKVVQEKANRQDSLMWSVIFCYFAGLLVILPRYSFLSIIRALVWPILFLWFIGQFRKKRSASSPVLIKTSRSANL